MHFLSCRSPNPPSKGSPQRPLGLRVFGGLRLHPCHRGWSLPTLRLRGRLQSWQKVNNFQIKTLDIPPTFLQSWCTDLLIRGSTNGNLVVGYLQTWTRKKWLENYLFWHGTYQFVLNWTWGLWQLWRNGVSMCNLKWVRPRDVWRSACKTVCMQSS